MYLTPREKIGTVLGVMSFFVNIGLVITPLVYGKLVDSAINPENSYYWVTRLSTTIAFSGLLLGIWTYLYDVFRNNGILSMNVEQRNVYFGQ